MERRRLSGKVLFWSCFFLVFFTWPVWADFSDGFNFPVGPNGELLSDDYLDVVNSIDSREIGLAQGYYVARKFEENTPTGKHLGDDWNGTCGGDFDLGHQVYAVSNGEVRYATDLGNGQAHAWGKVVIIRHEAPAGSRGFRRHNSSSAPVDWTVDSMYGHLESMLVNVGETVTKGQVIGTIGDGNGYYNTCADPNWECAHLHFEIRYDLNLEVGPGYSWDTTGWLNPREFLRANRMIFSDVASGFWGGLYIKSLVTHRIVSGEHISTGEIAGWFSPSRLVTRAEFTKMILLGAGVEVPMDPSQVGGTPFDDVPTTHALYVYVQTAKNLGVVSGVGSTNSFHPDEPTLRCEAIKMVTLAFGLPLVTGFALSEYFTDVPENEWYSDYLRTCFMTGRNQHHEGIVGGYPDRSFRPGLAMNRAEAAKMVARAMEVTLD